MLTSHWIALLCLLVLIGLLAWQSLGRRRGDRLYAPWPLQVRARVLTERELALFQRLLESLPEHIVLSQVQLARVLEFWPGARTQTLFNRISQLSIDFLVLDMDSRVVVAIQLDEGTRRGRPWSEARKTHALKSAGVPLITWSAWSLPDCEAIRLAVLTARADAKGAADPAADNQVDCQPGA